MSPFVGHGLQIQSTRQTEVGVRTEKEGKKTHEMGCEGPDGDKKRTKMDTIVHSKSTDSKVFHLMYMYFLSVHVKLIAISSNCT